MDESQNPILSVEEAAEQAILLPHVPNPYYDSEPESEFFFLSDDDDDDDEYHSLPPSPIATPPPESDPFLINHSQAFFDSCVMEIGTTIEEAMEEAEEAMYEDAQLAADHLAECINADHFSSGAVIELEVGDLDASLRPPEFADPDLYSEWVDPVAMENLSTFQEMDMDVTQFTSPISTDADPFSLEVTEEQLDCLPEHSTNQDQELEVELDEAASVDSSYPDMEEVVSNMEFEVFLALHEGVTAASKAAVESLPNITVDESLRDSRCAVCKEVFLVDGSVKRLPCSHDFHASCILPWLEIKNTCPLCRFEFPVDEPDFESWKRSLQENQV